MKISEILLSFLQKNKRLSLPGLGTFTLTDVAYAIPDKAQQAMFPQGSVSFVYSAATPEDPVLIAEISAITGKIKPLASSDLEALVIQGKQLINISKPFVIEGLGAVQRTNKGEIEFIQMIEADPKDTQAKHTEDQGEAIKFSENYLKPATKKPVRSKGLTLVSLAIVGTLLLGWVGYFAYQQSIRKDRSPIIMEKEPMAIQDTTLQRSSAINLEDLSSQQQPADTSAQTTEKETQPLDNAISSVSSTGSSVTTVETPAVKTDSLEQPIEKKKASVRKKVQAPKVDSVATQISIPVKNTEAEVTAPPDSLNRR